MMHKGNIDYLKRGVLMTVKLSEVIGCYSPWLWNDFYVRDANIHLNTYQL
jgi:drug/metabolite transporter superfamily protein YnfA